MIREGENACRGSALIYILVAIALLAALTATFMDSSSQQQSSQSAFKLQSELTTQIQTIRAAIQECVLTYPDGDKTMPANPVGGQSPNRPWPLMPSNTYLLNPTSSGWNNVQYIRCPGNPGNSNNHAKIFDSSSGRFFPPAPTLFSAASWVYYNSVDGVFFFMGSSKTDAYLKTVLQKINEQYSPCEIDVIDATSGAKNITTNGWTCPSGNMCLRVWIMSKPTSIFPDESSTCPPP